MAEKLKVAVVGGGVAGIVASHLIAQRHEVTLLEKNNYVGGHTNTIIIPDGPDAGTPVDTGFIVLNDQTYPLLHAFLKRLNVPWRFSDMSFGFSCALSGWEYAGTDLNGMFAKRSNLLSPRYYRFLFEIKRFCETALKELQTGDLQNITLRAFLERFKFSRDLIGYYVIPMGAAIWSSSFEGIFDFPAETFIQFFKNHGLLAIKDRPRWQTVSGGSFDYVRAFLKSFSGTVLTDVRIQQIVRKEDGVRIQLFDQVLDFDRLVIATHADEAFKLLDQPSNEEQKLLAPWTYHSNRTILHTDTSVLSPNRRAWASWNYRREKTLVDSYPANVTYHMNRLQGLQTKLDYCVTLNPAREIAASKIIREIHYTHPAFTMEAIATQRHLAELQGRQNTYFAGSYFGYGFHEDAVRSANDLARYFNVPALLD